MDPRINRDVVRYLRRLAVMIQEDAKRNCPKKTGHLAQSIKARVDESAKTVRIHTDVPYALDVEFGTRPHIIRARRAQVLVSDEGVVFGPVVHHPGTKAQPFMGPALHKHRGAL